MTRARSTSDLQSRSGAIANLFFNPVLPQLEDYYDPYTHKYSDLFDAPPSEQQPTAMPVSLITGEPIRDQQWTELGRRPRRL